ncbi:hypothetical protein [Actinoplanes subtropicus]|uniref:hypothetical protein n=1 Tax=Actinoplanes subtropicus TaxID=543632 RepID=UPI0004C417D4|nr:hypothetical protein [Actinoplanes subtropicus]
MAHEHLDVNSDQVNNLAEPYQYAAGDFSNLSGRVDEMWSRYRSAWGDDSIGAQVAPSFEQGFEYLRGTAKALHQTLTFYSDGLSQTGKVYGESEENAAEGGRKLDVAFSGLETPTFRAADVADDGSTLYEAGELREGRLLQPEEGVRRMERLAPEQPGEPRHQVMRAARLEERHALQPMRAERVEAPHELLPMRAERLERRQAIPEGAVIDTSIPPDDYGPWYRLPDGTILAHPARIAAARESPVTPRET